MASCQKWRRSSNYKNWKYRVKQRDGCCVMCGSTHKLEAHHLEDGSHNPDLRFAMKNGVTLCRKCHTAFHCMYKKSFRCKATQDDFINFVDLWNYVDKRARANIFRSLTDEEVEKLNAA